MGGFLAGFLGKRKNPASWEAHAESALASISAAIKALNASPGLAPQFKVIAAQRLADAETYVRMASEWTPGVGDAGDEQPWG